MKTTIQKKTQRNEVKANIEVDHQQLEFLLEQTALRPDGRYNPTHDEILIRVNENGVDTFAMDASKSVVTYCTYEKQFFRDIDVEDDRTFNAIVDPGLTLDRIKLLRSCNSSNDDAKIELITNEGSEFAISLDIHANHSVGIPCSTANNVKEQFPIDVRTAFDRNDRYQPSGGPNLTRIQADVDDLLDIVGLVDKLDLEYSYPIRVEKGELRIDAECNGNAIRGKISDKVHGPDFRNHYTDPFERVAKTLAAGAVSLQSGADQNLAIVQTGEDYVVRNIISHLKT